jgi:hypothetical protein
MHVSIQASAGQHGVALMKLTFIFLSLSAVLVGSTPARSETQLPINELYPCEVVLHELIADLRKLKVAAKHIAVELHDEDQKEQAASNNAAVQAYDDAISVATRKFDRCP